MAISTLPFEIAEKGVAFVCGTRVTLDTVIQTFLSGATAEEIVMRYPTLDLADVPAKLKLILSDRRRGQNRFVH